MKLIKIEVDEITVTQIDRENKLIRSALRKTVCYKNY